jgi:hypothetical protein
MDAQQDPLYQVHQAQAARRALSPLAHADFCARLPETYDTDLTGLLLPPPDVTVQVKVTGEPQFKLGQLCITPNAAKAVPADEVLQAIARHAAGDWGLLDDHDRQENERALGSRGRLVSVYQSSNGSRFYVITDAGWQTTTLLLPEDY